MTYWTMDKEAYLTPGNTLYMLGPPNPVCFLQSNDETGLTYTVRNYTDKPIWSDRDCRAEFSCSVRIAAERTGEATTPVRRHALNMRASNTCQPQAASCILDNSKLFLPPWWESGPLCNFAQGEGRQAGHPPQKKNTRSAEPAPGERCWNEIFLTAGVTEYGQNSNRSPPAPQQQESDSISSSSCTIATRLR